MFERDDTITAAQPQADDMGKALSMAAEIFASSQSAVPSSQPRPEARAAPNAEMSSDEIVAALAGLLAEKDTAPPLEETAAPEAQPLISASVSQSAEQTASSTEGAASGGSQAQPSGLAGIAAVLPSLMQAFSGKGEFIKPEKLNLIKAIKPYMTAARGDSIDRAIRMANIAQATKSALAALGR